MNRFLLVVNRVTLSFSIIFSFMFIFCLALEFFNFITEQNVGFRTDIPAWYVLLIPTFLINVAATIFTKNKIMQRIELGKTNHYLFEYFIIEHGSLFEKLKLNIPIFTMALMSLYILSLFVPR